MIQEVFADNVPASQAEAEPGVCICICISIPWWEMYINIWINNPF